VRLAKQCDVRVVAPVPWCPPIPDAGLLRQYARYRRIPRVEQRKGVEISHPRFFSGPGTSLYALEARAYAAAITRTAQQMHREAPFDLVHAHFTYPDGVVAGRLAGRWNVPFVVSEHAPWWSVWLDRPGVARQAIPAVKAAAAIFAVSSSVRDSIRSHAGEDPRIEIVPVGVDGELFKPLPNGSRRRDQILFVGIPKYVKGVDVLLNAVARLDANNLPGRLLVVGGSIYPNTRREEADLRRLGESLGLGHRVEFLGPRTPEQVAQLMAESAVVVLPSQIESFGAVLVEALACGTPVIATRCGGPEDIVTDAVGELVPVGDLDALTDALARILAEPDRWDRELLRSYALRRFGWDSIVDRTVELYHEALG
jgi:glycosyltransferase involved in cell wall biosynthesis